MTARNTRGFTVVELVVALAIAGLVLLIARAAMTTLADATLTTVARQEDATAKANAHRLLASVVGSIDVTSPGSQGFLGAADGFEATSWVRNAAGGFAMRRVFVRAAGGILHLGTTLLDTGVIGLHADYLLVPGASATWSRSWNSRTAPPVAIRLRIEHTHSTDTLLLVVGSRG